MIKKRRNPAGHEFGDIPIGTKFYFQGAEAKEFPGPYYKTRQYAAAKGGLDDPYRGQVGMHKSTRVLVEAYPVPRTNPRKKSAELLYSDIGTVTNAHKGQPHRCDPGCKKADHRYYHDFKAGKPMMVGLSPGQMITIPPGVFPILLWPQKDRAKLRVK